MKKAVFLDKDGTLVTDVPFNIDFSRVRFRDDVIPALDQLQRKGFLLILVSNQSGIAKGYFSMEEVNAHFRTIGEYLEANGIHITDFYFCPHEEADSADSASCTCHKPKPGLLFRAASEHGISLCASWMIGDILNDVEAGHRAGCRSILLDAGNETEWDLRPPRKPDHTVKTVTEAVLLIGKNEDDDE